MTMKKTTKLIIILLIGGVIPILIAPYFVYNNIIYMVGFFSIGISVILIILKLKKKI